MTATKSRTHIRSADKDSAEDKRTVLRQFGERLSTVRRERGESVEKFAETLDAKVNTVRDWLNGRVLPRVEQIRRASTKLDVTTDWLLGIPGAPKHSKQWRSDVELAVDVGAYVARKVPGLDIPLRPALSRSESDYFVDARYVNLEREFGTMLLSECVDRVRRNREAMAEYMGAFDTIAETYRSLLACNDEADRAALVTKLVRLQEEQARLWMRTRPVDRGLLSAMLGD